MKDHHPPAVASRIHEAVRLLELFASVGAESFDITHTNLQQEKRGFRPAQTLAKARESMPYLVPSAARRQNNLIIRPRSKTTALIQLDDITPENLARIAPAAFLVLQTSATGFQAWVAVPDAPPGIVARLRRGLGADENASGATRVAGTANFKAVHAPDFPVVRIVEARAGLTVTAEQLAAMNVLAPEAPAPPPLPFIASSGGPRTHKWPDYGECLARAPLGSSGSPKRTSADFVFCKIALSWGHSIEATATRLLAVSTKARENGEAYARKTAERAEYAARVRNAEGRDPEPR